MGLMPSPAPDLRVSCFFIFGSVNTYFRSAGTPAEAQAGRAPGRLDAHLAAPVHAGCRGLSARGLFGVVGRLVVPYPLLTVPLLLLLLLLLLLVVVVVVVVG